MDFSQDISTFQDWIGLKVRGYFNSKPSDQDGLKYFQENFWNFFGELQREGQRLLDLYQFKCTREQLYPLARTLQNITVSELEGLKARLTQSE